jgi:hypothetical protein
VTVADTYEYRQLVLVIGQENVNKAIFPLICLRLDIVEVNYRRVLFTIRTLISMPYAGTVGIASIIVLIALFSLSQYSWAQDESAEHELEKQAELAKKQLELEKELAQKEREASEDDDDERGIGLSFGRFDLGDMVIIGTVASVLGVSGYAGYKLFSIRRKASLARKKNSVQT